MLTDDEKEELKRMAGRSGEQIEQSAMFMSIFSESFKKDPLCALQLGIAVMLDKPIALLAIKGAKIPESLRKIAVVIEEVPNEASPGPEFAAASKRLMEKMTQILSTRH